MVMGFLKKRMFDHCPTAADSYRCPLQMTLLICYKPDLDFEVAGENISAISFVEGKRCKLCTQI